MTLKLRQQRELRRARFGRPEVDARLGPGVGRPPLEPGGLDPTREGRAELVSQCEQLDSGRCAGRPLQHLGRNAPSEDPADLAP